MSTIDVEHDVPEVAQLDPEFGAWVRRVRTNKGMTQEDLVARMRSSRQALQSLEQGVISDRQLRVSLFVKLAEAFGMELGYVLHKAGFDIGAGGVRVARLKRVESAADAFARAEGSMRHVLAEAIQALGDRDKLTEADVEMLTAGLGRALGALDLVTERLREQGFQSDSFRRVEIAPSKPRPWTDAETEFLINNTGLSNAEAARQLARTEASIRSRRGTLAREGKLSNNQEVSG